MPPQELLPLLEEKTHRFMERQYSCLHRSIVPALEKQGISSFLTAEVQMIPQNTVAVEGENLEAVQKMLDLFDEYDDVQEVFHNAELPEEEDEE